MKHFLMAAAVLLVISAQQNSFGEERVQRVAPGKVQRSETQRAALKYLGDEAKFRHLKRQVDKTQPGSPIIGLEYYDFKHCKNQDLKRFQVFPKLQRLKLYHCKYLTKAGFAHLQGLTALKSLSLEGLGKLSCKEFVALPLVKQLDSLELDSGTQLTDAGISELKHLPNLKTLVLKSGANLTDKGIAELKKCPQLKSFTFYHCPKLTDQSVTCFSEMPQLETLSLKQNDLIKSVDSFSSKNLKHFTIHALSNLKSIELVECKNLESLEIHHCRQCDSFDLVGSFPKLKRVSFSYMTKLPNNALSCLSGIKHLEVLEFVGCDKISAASFVYIKRIKTLRQLTFPYHAKISQKKMAELQKALPKCKIQKASPRLLGGGPIVDFDNMPRRK